MSDEKLKPCPFCGGEAEFFGMPPHETSGIFSVSHVRCSACGTVRGAPSEKEVIEAWNTRADVSIGMSREEAIEKASKTYSIARKLHGKMVVELVKEIYDSVEPKNVVARYVYSNSSIMELIRYMTSELSPLKDNGKIYTLTIEEEKDA